MAGGTREPASDHSKPDANKQKNKLTFGTETISKQERCLRSNASNANLNEASAKQGPNKPLWINNQCPSEEQKASTKLHQVASPCRGCGHKGSVLHICPFHLGDLFYGKRIILGVPHSGTITVCIKTNSHLWSQTLVTVAPGTEFVFPRFHAPEWKQFHKASVVRGHRQP